MAIHLGIFLQQGPQGIVPGGDEALAPTLQEVEPVGLFLALVLLTLQQVRNGGHVVPGQQVGDALVVASQDADVLDARRLLDGGPGRSAQLQTFQLMPGQGQEAFRQVLEDMVLALDLALARAIVVGLIGGVLPPVGMLHAIHSRCSRINWGLNSPRNSLTSRR